MKIKDSIIKFLAAAFALFNTFCWGCFAWESVFDSGFNPTAVGKISIFTLLFLSGVAPLVLLRHEKKRASFLLALSGIAVFGYFTILGWEDDSRNVAPVSLPVAENLQKPKP